MKKLANKLIDAMSWRWERNAVPALGSLLPQRRLDVDIEKLHARRTCIVMQPMRCGGTLLTRLLDGHPALNVRPYHYVAARSSKQLSGEIWINDRELNLVCKSLADVWREFIYDPRFYRFRVSGLPMRLENRSLAKRGAQNGLQKMIIDLDCVTYYQVLREILPDRRGEDAFAVEEVVAAAFTGFFAAWRNRRLSTGDAKFNVSHAPRHATTENFSASCANFFASMPNGKLITTLRDPVNWVASFTRSGITHESVEEAVGFYDRYLRQLSDVCQSARPDQFQLISFESLVTEPQEVMKRVADFFEITFTDALCTPTRDGIPEGTTNTSFPDISQSGPINTQTLKRGKSLSDSERGLIAERLTEPYERILGIAVQRKLAIAA